jgi:hypothetical protein
MRHPRVIILDSDRSLARLLRELVGESRWLVHEPARSDTALSLVREAGPAVLVVQFEPGDEKAERCALVGDSHRLAPDVPVVAVSDAKMPDADRAAWTAVLLDLGARYVLFPPVTKPVLEDVVSGLMAAAVRRAVGADMAPPRVAGDIIDLADEGLHR